MGEKIYLLNFTTILIFNFFYHTTFLASGSSWRSLSYEYLLQFRPDSDPNNMDNNNNATTVPPQDNGSGGTVVQTSTTVVITQGQTQATHLTVPIGGGGSDEDGSSSTADGTYNLSIR